MAGCMTWTLLPIVVTMIVVLPVVRTELTAGFRGLPPRTCRTAALPAGMKEWQPTVAGSALRIEWGYEGICSTINTCYGLGFAEDTDLEPQLMPVQVQPGINIEFYPTAKSDVDFSLQPFKVDEKAFRNCDMSNGTDVLQYAPTNAIIVPQDLLTNGPNYFVGNTSDPLTRCTFGLRLNLTIMAHSCAGPGDIQGLCSERGRCVATGLDSEFHCQCCLGYTGEFCYDEDGCADQPCRNGGTCLDLTTTNSQDKFACSCPLGFHGAICEIEVDNMCTHSPCVNNGTCMGTRSDYECICPHGYSGHHCEVNLNDCQVGPCKHGVCVDMLGGYQCYCTPGYGGHNCDRQYNECEINPCVNGGFCISHDGEHECHCTQGYTGDHCDIKVDLCNPTPCVNATECVDYGHTYMCTCNTGYIGIHCEVDINECESNPCQNGGKCHDSVAGYSCKCLPGVSGLHCEYTRQTLPRKDDEDGDEDEDRGMHRSAVDNLYIVAGTLGGALLIALLVLTICYCKVHETYKKIVPNGKSNEGYIRHRSDSVSTSDPRRVAPESIMGANNQGYHDQSNRSLAASLKPRRI